MNEAENRMREAGKRSRRRIEDAANCSPVRISSGEIREQIHGRLARLRAEIATEFGQPQKQNTETPLDRIFVERAISILKHGVVESCFYNLRILAQEAILDELPTRELERLRRASDSVATVRTEVDRFLDHLTPGGRRVGELLPEVEKGFDEAISGIPAALRPGAERPAEIPVLIDIALGTMADASRRLWEQRVPLIEVFKHAIEMEQPRLQEAGLKVELATKAPEDRIHADRDSLLRCAVELLRNATQHCLRPAEDGVVRILAEETPNRLELVVENRPAMAPVVPVEALLEPGGSRRPSGGDGLASVRRDVASCGGSVDLSFDAARRLFRVCLAFPLRLPI